MTKTKAALHGTTILCLSCLCAPAAPGKEPGTAEKAKRTFITFDVPGAAMTFGGTFPNSINAAGVIAGTCSVSGYSGFVRTADGAITTFEAPGGVFVTGTNAEAINAAGTITGYYTSEVPQGQGNPILLAYGFVRAADGTFTTFSAPNAGTGGYPYHQGTYSLSINKAGAIGGYYVDINGVSHGFAGTAAGAITSFDPPGSVGTYGESINAAGDIAGYYVDASAADHGFVRAADGSITTFDAPGGSTSGPRGTQAWSINAAGAVAGYYFKTNTLYRGFVRAPGGAITTFDVPGATVPGTMAVSINAAGTITGSYSDKKGVYRGFVRSASGAITTFSAPGADTLTGPGTHPASINDAGEIAGSYIDASDVTHGFLLK
jgi:hypothetical protein